MRDFVGGPLQGDSKAEAKSADLEISAGTTESAFGYGECGNNGWRISSAALELRNG